MKFSKFILFTTLGAMCWNIVLAAIDTTMAPVINIDGKQLPNSKEGLYEVTCNRSGIYNIDGFLEVPHGDGLVDPTPFPYLLHGRGTVGDRIGPR